VDVRPERLGVQRPLEPEGSRERSATVSEVDADQVGVHVRTSSRQSTPGISGEDTTDHDDAQQGWLLGADPAAHTGAHRARASGRFGVYRAHSAAGGSEAAGSATVSGWMSMRQPVRRAAKRAFWPSLPMASDSL
jgi:hypothetical protein